MDASLSAGLAIAIVLLPLFPAGAGGIGPDITVSTESASPALVRSLGQDTSENFEVTVPPDDGRRADADASNYGDAEDAGGIQWIRQFGREGEVAGGVVAGTSGFWGHMGIAVDDSGVYVAGSALGPLMGQTNPGAFVRKYDLDGNEAWTRQFGTSMYDEATDVAVDASGVYVVGLTTTGGQTSQDAFVRKYDLDGNEIWKRQFGTSSADAAWGVAVDPSGVYVAGFTYGALAGQVSAGAWDAFVRKYDIHGNEVWTRQFGGRDTDGSDGAFGVAVDDQGVYVAGFAYSAFSGQTFAGYRDAFVRKYDVRGNEVWTRQFGTSESELAFAITVDISGLYVAGSASGALPGQTNTGGEDAFVRKYDIQGNEVWTRQFGTSGWDHASGIAVGRSAVYVAGIATSALPGQTTAGGFIRKYDVSGSEIWTRQFGSSAYGVAVDISGVHVAGAGAGGGIVRRYDDDGTEVWTRQFGSTWWDSATGIAVDPSGVYVVEWTAGWLDTEVAEAFVRKYDVDGNEVWTRQFTRMCPSDDRYPPSAGKGGLRPGDPLDIAADPTGVYVSGTVYCYRDYPFVLKYDAHGNVVWLRLVRCSSPYCPHSGRAGGIAVDASGVYLAGFAVGYGTTPDAFVRKYDVDGNTVWTRTRLWYTEVKYQHPFFSRIAVGAWGVYVAVGTWETQGVFALKYDVDGIAIWTRQWPGRPAAIAIDASGVYTAGSTVGKYDVDGNEVWTREFGTPSWASGIAIDASGVYVAGSTNGTFPGQTSAGGYDAFLRKYDVDGNESWTTQFGTSESDRAAGIAVDASGVYVAGETLGVFPTQTSAGGQDAFVARLGGPPGAPRSAPENLRATAGDEQVTLSWQAPVFDGGLPIAGYKVYRGTVSDGETFLVEIGNVLSYTDTGVANGVTYYYQVSALNAAGEGPRDNEVSATPPGTSDNAPPGLNVPGPIIAEATGPSGAQVYYTATAEDDVDGSLALVCSPASGTVFPLGITTVMCTARDAAGNEATATFTVQVRDSRPPILTVPADIQVEATGPSGAPVTFEVTATDLVDPSPVVSCSPPSGSTFGIGTTTVTCTATESAGNNAAASFKVTVTEPVGPSGVLVSPLAAAAIVVAVGSVAVTVLVVVRRWRKGRGPSGGEGGTR